MGEKGGGKRGGKRVGNSGGQLRVGERAGSRAEGRSPCPVIKKKKPELLRFRSLPPSRIPALHGYAASSGFTWHLAALSGFRRVCPEFGGFIRSLGVLRDRPVRTGSAVGIM